MMLRATVVDVDPRDPTRVWVTIPQKYGTKPVRVFTRVQVTKGDHVYVTNTSVTRVPQWVVFDQQTEIGRWGEAYPHTHPMGQVNGLVDMLNSLVPRDQLFVNVADHDVKGDGESDDTQQLNNALQFAAKTHAPVWIPGYFNIGLTGQVKIPDGTTIHTNGTTFRALKETGNFLISTGSRNRIIGDLRVQIPAGSVNSRGVLVNGSNSHIDGISVLADSEGTGLGNVRNNAVAMYGCSDITIGKILVANFENAVRIEDCSQVMVSDVQINTYRQGVYITNSSNVTIQNGLVRGRSAASTGGAGDNGVLIDSKVDRGTSNVKLHMVVEDSAEHGYRIGGNKIVQGVVFDGCISQNTGASGFKILGGTVADKNYHEDIKLAHCTVIDAGTPGSLSNNQCGVMVQLAIRCTITDLNVYRVNKAYSAHTGVRVTGCTDVLVANPVINATFESGVAFDSQLGNQTNVKLVGGIINTSAGDGVRIQFTGCVFRRVNIIGETQIEATGFALRVVNDSGGSLRSMPTVNFSTSSTQVATGVTAAYLGNVFAPIGDPASAQSFAPGSVWVDASGTGRFQRKNGAWVAL